MRYAITGHAVNTTYTDVGSADIAEEQISVIPVSSTAASLLLTDLQ